MLSQPAFISQLSRPQKQFSASLLAALLFHVLLVTAVKWVPAETKFEAPVRLLKIKLGNSSVGEAPALAEVANMPTESADKPAVVTSEDAAKPSLSHKGQAKVIAKAAASKKATKQAKAAIKHKKKSKGAVAKTFKTKKLNVPAQPKVAGDVLGNTQQAAQQRAIRYTQKISLWIEKFKDYPQEVKDFGMEGVVKIYLTMDRKGNIRSHQIMQHAPYPILDKLAMDAVRRASPVPAVPDNYPDKSKNLAFIIALKFRLNR